MKLKILALLIFVGTFFGLVGNSQAQMEFNQLKQALEKQAVDQPDGGPFHGGQDDAQVPGVAFDEVDGDPAPEADTPGEQVFVDDDATPEVDTTGEPVFVDDGEETEEPEVDLPVEEDAGFSLQGSGRLGCSLMTTVPLTGPMGLLLASVLGLLPLWIRRFFK